MSHPLAFILSARENTWKSSEAKAMTLNIGFPKTRRPGVSFMLNEMKLVYLIQKYREHTTCKRLHKQIIIGERHFGYTCSHPFAMKRHVSTKALVAAL